MPPSPRPPLLLAALVVALALVSPAAAQTQAVVGTLRRVHEFPRHDGLPIAALIRARDGCFYGTTSGQGRGYYGTIFKLTPAGEFNVLHRFAGPEGALSHTPLLQGSDGALYGTAAHGGAHARGTIFRLALDGTFTTLHSFAGPDGAYPSSALVQTADGYFYGVARNGGDPGSFGGAGTVFRLAPDGALTTLHRFTMADGAHPVGALLPLPDGSFYGTTHDGGAHGDGTIFQLSAAGDLRTVHDFNGQDGDAPLGPLLLAADGSLYGVTHNGGENGIGTVFKLAPDGTLTSLHSFSGDDSPPDGDTPQTSLLQGRDGSIYGTATEGGLENNGTLFRLAPDGTLATLYNFDSSERYPAGALLQAGSDFYGVTRRGGQLDGGTIFRYNPGAESRGPTATLSAPVPDAVVGSGVSGEFRVTLSRASAADLTVIYAVRGDALPGVDYPLLKGTLTIKAGQMTKVIPIPARGDLQGATSKTVRLKLFPGNGYTVGTPKGVKVRLIHP